MRIIKARCRRRLMPLVGKEVMGSVRIKGKSLFQSEVEHIAKLHKLLNDFQEEAQRIDQFEGQFWIALHCDGDEIANYVPEDDCFDCIIPEPMSKLERAVMEAKRVFLGETVKAKEVFDYIEAELSEDDSNDWCDLRGT